MNRRKLVGGAVILLAIYAARPAPAMDFVGDEPVPFETPLGAAIVGYCQIIGFGTEGPLDRLARDLGIMLPAHEAAVAGCLKAAGDAVQSAELIRRNREREVHYAMSVFLGVIALCAVLAASRHRHAIAAGLRQSVVGALALAIRAYRMPRRWCSEIASEARERARRGEP